MAFYRQPVPQDLGLDQGLLWSALLLLCIGLVMVYSASIAMAEAERFTGFRSSFFLGRHAIYLAIGVVVAAALFRVPLWVWQKASPWLFMAGGAARHRVDPGPGREVNGSRRWTVRHRYLSALGDEAFVAYADYTVRKAAFMDDSVRASADVRGDDLRRGAVLRELDFGALVVITTIAMTILFPAA